MLLKNNRKVLPLRTGGIKLALIGTEAKNPTVHGGGSGQVIPYYTASPLDAIRRQLGLPIVPTIMANCSEGNLEQGVGWRNEVCRILHPPACTRRVIALSWHFF